MTGKPTPPPRKAGRAAVMIVAVIAAMIVAIFVGFNFYHADTLRERQSGQVDPQDAPKSATDLQKLPAPRR
jgi:hypothetical protein